MFQHHRIWNSQQPYTDRPQIILFDRVFPHLADLRMNAAVKLDRQAMLEAVGSKCEPPVQPRRIAVDEPVLDD